ncbi:phage tail assembly chaperone [Alphaproteobacteria bacterium KMM 3653]|uniref:Phage tail assembly chaperone n=1 Tax=Harenicola maris TaxID=2841044 RepID=A0AAP2G816_9RHOB|nr:phage tail assembly chaperone [Harenicola maris]
MDWAGLLRLGLGRLRLSPADFWALTPYELTLMLGLEPGDAPLTRARLDALTQAFPDTPKGELTDG